MNNSIQTVSNRVWSFLRAVCLAHQRLTRPEPDGAAAPSGLGAAPHTGRRRALASLAAILLGCGAAVGAEPTNAPSRSVSLQECFCLALSNNLDLKIERYNPSLALRDLDIARAGYDPVFKASGEHSYSVSGGGLDDEAQIVPPTRTDTDSFSSGISGLGPMGLAYDLSGNIRESSGTRGERIPFNSANGSVGISLTQPLLKNFIIDNTRYNIQVARKRLQASEARLEEQIISVITSVELAYYDLIAAREYVKVQEDGLRLAQRLAEENRRRVQIGILARLDEKQSEADMAARQADVSSARRALTTAQNALKRLLTDAYRTWHEVSLEPTEKLLAMPQVMDLQESWRTGLAKRPDLKQARIDLERQGITVRYYKNQMLPELNLVGGYGHGGSDSAVGQFNNLFSDFQDGSKPFWSVGGTFSIPLSNKAARERYRQGKATAEQLLLSLKKLEESALIEIDEAVNQIRSSFDRVESTRQARLYAEQALDAEQKKLESGASTSFVVLRLQRDLTSARSEELRALTDYNRSLASLRRVEGTTLEQKQLTLEAR